jgi:Mor family transcriptional regulator
MKYRKASEVLPDWLLREVQRFAAGETLYVPSQGAKKAWGEGSGARSFYEERNARIRADFAAGIGIDELAERYALSADRIRRIVYGIPPTVSG